MARVLSIDDGRTLTVERNGVRERVRLAGVDVTDDARARDLLRWTAGDAWVMLEPAPGGEFLVYRSPDALFINRELVLRGYARATAHGIEPDLRAPSRYLGTIDPPLRPAPAAKAPRVDARQDRSGSGASRRSAASPEQKARARPRKPR